MTTEKQLSDGEFRADKLMDLANLSAAALVIGQLIVPEIRWSAFVLGVALYVTLFVVSERLRG